MPRLRPPIAPPLTLPTAAAVVVCAGVVAYHRSFTRAFALDDLSFLTVNPSIRQLWPLATPPGQA